MDNKKEFVYELLDEVKYMKSGQETVASTVTVTAPNNKVLREISIIEIEYKKAETKMSEIGISILGQENLDKIIENRANDKDAKALSQIISTPKQVIETLYAGGADIMKCFDALKHILNLKVNPKPFCFIDGTERMTSNFFDDMSPTDTKNILAEYISSFIIASQKE